MTAHIHDFINFLHQHPHWGGFFAFLIAFSESIAIIGSLIPGSVTMTAVGALIGASVLPATSTILWAIFGAMSGDIFSYWLGAHFQDRIKKVWPFRRYPKWLEAGEAFFHKHGGKSVIIGRYAGVMRSAVPMIAGILKMKFSRFLFAAVPAAISWAILYMLPGIILGALSLELPAGTATKFILYVLLLIALAWLLFWLTHFFFRTIWGQIDKVINRVWKYLEVHKPTHWFTTALYDPHPPNGHTQLTLFIFTIACGLLFVIIALNVMAHGWLTHANVAIFSLLRSFRVHAIEDIMLAFTLLGYKYTLFIFTAMMAVYFLWIKHYRALIHWVAVFIVSAGAIKTLKLLVHSPRPAGLMNGPTTFSFPSGHTALSLTLFGFLAMLIAKSLPEAKRKYVYRITTTLVVLIAFSRLYLGAHWLTDILGSFMLGCAIITFFTLAYRRKKSPDFSAKQLITVSLSGLLIAWLAYGIPNFKQQQYDYSLYWPTTTTTTAKWWNLHPDISLYATSRLGKANQPLNIQWLDSLDNIQTLLENNGWVAHPAKLTLHGAAYRLHPKDLHSRLPFLPKLYHNQVPALLMTKTRKDKPPLVLRIWRADVELTGNPYPLWLGSINIYTPPHKWLTLKDEDGLGAVFRSALSSLLPELKNYQIKTVIIPTVDEPPSIQRLNWDGKVLLIRAK